MFYSNSYSHIVKHNGLCCVGVNPIPCGNDIENFSAGDIISNVGDIPYIPHVNSSSVCRPPQASAQGPVCPSALLHSSYRFSRSLYTSNFYINVHRFMLKLFCLQFVFGICNQNNKYSYYRPPVLFHLNILFQLQH